MALLVLSVAACGNGKVSSTGSGNGGTTEPTRLTIFMASDRLKGSNESKVISAVEDKFLADTGKAIDLNILIYNKSDFANAVTSSAASSSWDAAVSYLGIAGVDDNLIRRGAAADLADYLDSGDYENIVDNVGDNINSLTTVTGAVYGVTSVNETNDYGILVRKDWMKQVGYTDSAAEAAASNGTLTPA